MSYWEKRVDIFGEKAFQPLTLSEALAGDEQSFGLGAMTLLSTKDPSGRALVYYDPSKLDKSKYTTKSMVRTFWYVFHAALENEDAEKRGVIFLIDPGRAKFSNFDRSVAKLMAGSIKGALPVRVSAIHVIHPPTFFKLIWPIMKVLLSERLRKRLNLHSGSDEVVLKKLNEKFGLELHMLPKEVGGHVTVDHKGWLQHRSESSL